MGKRTALICLDDILSSAGRGLETGRALVERPCSRGNSYMCVFGRKLYMRSYLLGLMMLLTTVIYDDMLARTNGQ